MAIYFLMNEILDQLEKIKAEGRARFQIMIPVSSEFPEGKQGDKHNADDVFILSSTPKLLDLNHQQAIYQLSMLLDDAPLYHINMQLVLDDALTERHKNATLERALEKAFVGEPLPNTLTSGDKAHDEPAGSLRHPMLEHVDTETLCRYYVSFIRALPDGHATYGFERNILGKHGDHFMESFDGFLSGTQGKIKAEILVGFGSRRDHDLTRPAESYIPAGEKTARAMKISEPHELLWAWLEADDYQMRRCRDIHRLLSLGGLPRLPNWVRTDIFCFLEREAMKQQFAQMMKDADANLSFMKGATTLKEAVDHNAHGGMDEQLQQLQQLTQSTGMPYHGAAGQFATDADRRLREAQREKLS